MYREHLIEVCRELLAGAGAGVFAGQVARTLERILPAERLSPVRRPQDVVDAFTARGLLPSLLIYLCAPLVQEAASADQSQAAELLALCFAASAYPQRPYRMTDREIRRRVESFAGFYKQVASDELTSTKTVARIAAGECLPSTLPKSFSAAEIRLLLSDIGASEWVTSPDPSAEQRQKEERLAGAVFFLATCYTEMIERTRALWANEAGFVRYFRTYLYAPPSEIAGEGDQPYPDWSRVRSRLAAMFSEEAADFHERGIILEQTARNRVLAYTPIGEVGGRVTQFWQEQRDRLLSGFAYYAFRSRFVYWWKQCAMNYHPPPLVKSLDEAAAQSIAASAASIGPAHNELTLEELRLQGEGYRLVRTTFFPRQDKASDEADAPLETADENERWRNAIDEIWYNHLQAPGEEEPSRLGIQEIVQRHPFLNQKTIYVLIHRLRLRMWAYTLARVNRLSNDKIRSAKRRSAKGKADCPLAAEPGVLTVASLARIISLDETLLGAFTAHLFLHPQVVPQRPNPIRFGQYVGELWWWVTAETFDDAIKRGAAAGSPVHRAARLAEREDLLASVIQGLRDLKDRRELELYLTTHDFAAEQRTASRLVTEMIGGDEVYKSFERHVRDWRRLTLQHWVVPVWYLLHIQRLREEELLPRLIVDEREASALAALCQAMSRQS